MIDQASSDNCYETEIGFRYIFGGLLKKQHINIVGEGSEIYSIELYGVEWVSR